MLNLKTKHYVVVFLLSSIYVFRYNFHIFQLNLSNHRMVKHVVNMIMSVGHMVIKEKFREKQERIIPS